MSYDDYKTESDRDYEDRMQVHRGGGHFEYPAEGPCACGTVTTRAVGHRGGYRFECKPCSVKAFDALFTRGVRQAS